MNEPALPKSLRWLRHWRKTLTRMGINYAQFCLIISTKLTLANRSGRTSLTGQKRPRKTKRPARTLLWTFLGNLLIGALIGLMMFIPMVLFSRLAVLFGFLFLMFFLTMLTSYASLLLDPRDRPIFTVRGVSDRTLNAAKLTIVGLFLLVTMAALALPAAIILGLQFGVLVGIAVLIAAFVLAIFSLVIALFMYMLVLHFFDGEKLKNILNVVQIGMAIALYAAGQLPNILGPDVISHMNFNLSLHFVWWEFIAVPMWFSGLPLLAHGDIGSLSLLFTFLSVAVTAGLFALYLHNAGRFEQLLEKLDQSSDRVAKAGWWFKLTRSLATRSRETAAYYTLGWRQLQSQRDYKLRVYPQLAYAFILPLVLVASIMRDSAGSYLSHMVGYMAVCLIIAAPLAILNLKFSTQPTAMAVFNYVPFGHQSRIRQSVILAMYMRLFFPFIVIMALLSLPFMGLHAVTAGLASTALTLALTLAIGKISLRGLPFDQEFAANQAATNGVLNTVAVLLGMLLAFAYAFAGTILFSYWFDLVSLAIFSVVAGLLIRSNRFA